MRGHTAPRATMPDAGRPGSRKGAGLQSSSVAAESSVFLRAARSAAPGEAGIRPAFASNFQG